MKLKLIILLLLSIHIGLMSQGKRPVDLVYPLLDAANSRWFYFSSACRPFGLVSLFPDTEIDGEWQSGYRYNTDTVRMISHIHEWQLAGVAVMPVTFQDSCVSRVLSNYSSPFSHTTEKVRPGYHSFILDRFQTKVELTATDRVGFHKYHFPKNEKKAVVFELGGQQGPSRMVEGGFSQISDHEIRGFVVNGKTLRRPKTYPVYFCAVFDKPIKNIRLLGKGTLIEGITQWKGVDGRILVELAGEGDNSALMKVGVSYVSEEGAAKNVNAEVPHWRFDKTLNEASERWNSMLSRINIEGGTEQQQRRFYTDLWHAIQGRRQITDADGRYTDCTGPERTIKQVPLDSKGRPRFNMYNSDSFWGAQWTLNTLWQLVYPEISEEFCNSFLEYYKNGGLIPRGPSGGNYTYVMTGASSTPFFVGAWQKGIKGFDIAAVYEGLKKNHMPGGMMDKVGYEHNTSKGGGLESYIKMGYVPYPLSDTIFGMHQDGGTITLENAYQDWCLAQLSKSLGNITDYDYFMKRSENFKNIYHETEQFMVPKSKNGNWQTPFDPLVNDKGFEEANSAQYTWFVPHNLDGLFSLIGGKDSVIKRLDRQFELGRANRFCGGWVNYANQPGTQMAFIFNHAGAPWLTQYWSRAVIDSAYSKLSFRDGYNGDEDQGLMGSLSVLMKMGIFQMTGGCEENPQYELGSPLFDKVTISLHPDYFKAKKLVIETKNNSEKNCYIKSANLNGKPLKNLYFRHSDINERAFLWIEMDDKPNKNLTCHE